MPQIVAYEDAKVHQFRRKDAMRTPFLNRLKSSTDPDKPVAFLSQGDPNRVIDPHYHLVDEFLLIAEGSGVLGRSKVAPYSVFFARAFTPYGPLVGDSKTGVGFFVLSARFEEGAQYLPETLDNLKQMPDRRPWQIKRQVKFPTQGNRASSGPVILQEIPGIMDDQGLCAYTLVMAPGAKTVAPDPCRGDGQFVVTVKGSLWHDNKEHKAYTVVFVESREGPFQLHAGSEGLEAIIMNFPEVKPRAAEKTAPSAVAGFRKWQCELCAFVYDEASGLPDDGIPAGTRWKDVPESWICPDCSATKSDFRMVEVQ